MNLYILLKISTMHAHALLSHLCRRRERNIMTTTNRNSAFLGRLNARTGSWLRARWWLETTILRKTTFSMYTLLHMKQSLHKRIYAMALQELVLNCLIKTGFLRKSTFQLYTPTPPLLIEGSISSTFQTPQNPHQLDHKVRSIQRSLQKKNLSSSPISHIQHLEKAAQMAMNMNLLQEEIKVLRAENERKKKKKARKHASPRSLSLYILHSAA